MAATLADTRNRLVSALGAAVNADEIVTTLDKVAAVTAGTPAASKAVLTNSSNQLVSLDVLTLKSDSITLTPLILVRVTVTAALLDSAGTAPVIVGGSGDQFIVVDVKLIGGGTNYAAGGDRLISLTDGTTVYTTIANADIETAPATTLPWGNAKVPFLTGVNNTPTAAASTLRFQYSGGTTDHSATGSIIFHVILAKVA